MKLLVLGLDAATWDIADPLMAEGMMPALASIVGNGCRAPLRSTDPPITPPAWTTIITGMDPARHAVASFCRPDEATGLVAPTQGGDRLVRTLFDFLGEQGAHCGAVNIPWTYPAETWPGFVVSGLDAPQLGAQSFSPFEAGDILREAAPEYALHCDVSAGPQAALRQIDAKTDALLALARWRSIDVLFAVIMETDTVAHVHWPESSGALDSRHPLAQVYQAADEALGRLIDELAPETVVVLSDHGMGRASHGLANLSRPLFDAGLMRPGGSPLQRAVLPLYRTARWVHRRVRPRRGGAAEGQGGAGVSRWAPRADWQASRAHSGVGFGWVSIDPGAGPEIRAQAREAVGSAASRLDPPPLLDICEFEGGPVPDLLFRVDHGAGYWLCPPILDPREPLIIRDPHHPAFQQAGHRRNGIFAATGRGIATCEADDAIPARDVAPTLLHLAGCDLPQGLDGSVATGLLDAAHLSDHPVATYETCLNREPTSADDAGDRDAVARRLRDLGYME